MAATRKRATKPVVIAQSLSAAAAVLLGPAAEATILPEERADAMYHHYDGGGVDIDGPSVLVRQNFADKVSVSANYYVDSVTSASIDVVTTASAYAEERTETRLGVDFLNDKTLMGINWVKSDENDYHANTLGFSASQDFFGDLSTLSFGYSFGSNDVGRNNDPAFGEHMSSHDFRLGFSQVLSRKAVMSLATEVIADEGFLNNPYRSVRYVDANPLGYSYQAERYPNTHTSTALALRFAYHLPWQDALKAEYRVYDDTWGIAAENIELGYSRDLTAQWRVDARVRTYSQTHADFYSDLFPFRDAQNYLGRDKELSSFDSLLYGAGVSYILKAPETSRWAQMSFNLQIDFVNYDYGDFRDLRKTGAGAGNEPLYGYDAVVTRLYYSIWY